MKRAAKSVVPAMLVMLSVLAASGRNQVLAAGPVLEGQTCIELVAGQPRPMGQGITVGEVCVVSDGDNLLVEFRAADGWTIAETHLAVASSLDRIPRAEAGNPQLGRFPYRATHSSSVTEFTHSIPLEELGVRLGAEVVVAAHASVESSAGTEEGAWGRGEKFSTRGNPAMYFTYSIAKPD